MDPSMSNHVETNVHFHNSEKETTPLKTSTDKNPTSLLTVTLLKYCGNGDSVVDVLLQQLNESLLVSRNFLSKKEIQRYFKTGMTDSPQKKSARILPIQFLGIYFR